MAMLKRLLLGAMLALVLVFPAVGAGVTPQFAVRVVTAAGAVTVTTSDYTICINKTSGAATTVNLPASPKTGQRHIIKDCKGDAATNNITIVPNAGTIDGAANFVIATNNGGVMIEYMASKWVVLAQYTGATLVSPAYFVATAANGGSDSNDGSLAHPFLTLAHAQTAMQSGSKATYVLGGTYALGTGLALVAADSNTAWRGYPGQIPVIDGGGTVARAFTIDSGASGITVNGLTIQNFTDTGVDFMGDGMVITNNTIRNLTSPSTNTGGIYAHFTLGTAVISHNLILNNAGPGIVWGDGAGDPGISGGLTIDRNIVLTTNTVLTDTGGIYIFDPKHSCSAIVVCSITNNIVGDYGRAPGSTSLAKGIYLDDNTSYVLVSGNVVYGVGNWALQVHGGDHNNITNNVWDITGAVKLGLYQESTLASAANMASNSFTKNIIYSSASDPASLWDYFFSSVAPIVPTDANNLYFRTGGSFANKGSGSGEFTDSNPVVGDPLFVNVAAHDYTVSGGSPALSSPISWTQLVHDQGPH